MLLGAIVLLHAGFQHVDIKNNTTNRRRYAPLLLLEQILAQWQRPVAYSEALDLLNWVMRVPHIAMAI